MSKYSYLKYSFTMGGWRGSGHFLVIVVQAQSVRVTPVTVTQYRTIWLQCHFSYVPISQSKLKFSWSQWHSISHSFTATLFDRSRGRHWDRLPLYLSDISADCFFHYHKPGNFAQGEAGKNTRRIVKCKWTKRNKNQKAVQQISLLAHLSNICTFLVLHVVFQD